MRRLGRVVLGRDPQREREGRVGGADVQRQRGGEALDSVGAHRGGADRDEA